MGSASRVMGQEGRVTSGLFYLCPCAEWFCFGWWRELGCLRTFEPRDISAELLAELDGGWMEWHPGGLGPELELIAAAVAGVAVVAAAGEVCRERTWTLARGFVEWTWSVPLIGSAMRRFEAEQAQDLFHRHFGAQPIEIDTRHRLIQGGFG